MSAGIIGFEMELSVFGVGFVAQSAQKGKQAAGWIVDDRISMRLAGRKSFDFPEGADEQDEDGPADQKGDQKNVFQVQF